MKRTAHTRISKDEEPKSTLPTLLITLLWWPRAHMAPRWRDSKSFSYPVYRDSSQYDFQ